MSESVYDIAVKLSLSTDGVATATTMAMRAFGGIEGGAGQAERALAALHERMRFQEFAGQQHTTAYQWNLQRQAGMTDQATRAQDRLNASLRSA